MDECNGIPIQGDKTFADYGIVPMTVADFEEIWIEVFGYL